MDVVWFPKQNVSPRMLTETFWIGAKIRLPGGGSIIQYVVSATLDIWGSAGNQVLTAANIPVKPSSKPSTIQLNYMLYTGRLGSGRPITVADTYRAVFTVKMTDNSTNTYEQIIVIEPIPF